MKIKTIKIAYGIAIITLSMLFVDCTNCSRSGRNSTRDSKPRYNSVSGSSRHGKTMVKMSEENGIYKIPVEINGSNMNFIFDTGASIISMSATEAMFLYKQGTLKEEDFIGNVNFQDATGAISEGTVIRLKSVKIGNKTLENVEASVVHNSEAPLLFGQSALAEFGKISIDYKRNEITFE
ncbi:retroviral-like aspartic protease family protein [Flavobacterium sp. P4023]|uniref:Retroviral-like aspartic protease family protein n=1 Tax=Flavobacterium flabelliforme TaxID=2816119 RepID=A0ABS5CTN6_9FLAO|nr:retropepsin-like aspartic protease [Flavobacterium flabelliforme]MBP4141968.1 retroviral-like aspartic protease family protein [Flavobacterium flabelliforme]